MRIALSLVLAAAIVAPAAASDGRYFARAYDRETNAHIYTEWHAEEWRDGRLEVWQVEYRNPEGVLLASKLLDPGEDRIAPTFEFRDVRHGHVEGVVRDGDGLLVFGRRHERDELRQKSLAWPRQAVIDAGFHHFIRDRWSDLVDGRKVEFEFAFPTAARFLRLRVQRKESAEEGQVRIKMEAANRFLRLVSDPVWLTYCEETRRLLVYEGASNLRDADGKTHDVRIEFEYPDPSSSVRSCAPDLGGGARPAADGAA